MTDRPPHDLWCEQQRATPAPQGFVDRVMRDLPAAPPSQVIAMPAGSAWSRAAVIALATLGALIKAAAWLTPFIPWS